MASIVEGRVWAFGDHVDTDVILPARYLVTFDPAALAAHCFEGIDPALAAQIRPGDIVVAGENFGCGSSREHAAIAIKGLGVACVVARSYGQIFYRNAFNVGLPLLESDLPPAAIRTGDLVAVDLADGRIENRTTREIYQAAAIPPFMQELIDAGGLISFVLGR